MKEHCAKCFKLAVWMYAPNSRRANYCDDCVPRGCSCNIDPNTGLEDKDDDGRYYPCCEYIYDDNGFDVITNECNI